MPWALAFRVEPLLPNRALEKTHPSSQITVVVVVVVVVDIVVVVVVVVVEDEEQNEVMPRSGVFLFPFPISYVMLSLRRGITKMHMGKLPHLSMILPSPVPFP